MSQVLSACDLLYGLLNLVSISTALLKLGEKCVTGVGTARTVGLISIFPWTGHPISVETTAWLSHALMMDHQFHGSAPPRVRLFTGFGSLR